MNRDNSSQEPGAVRVSTSERTSDIDTADLAQGFRQGDPASVDTVRARVQRILSFGKFRFPREEQDDLEQEILAELWKAARKPGFDASEKFWGFVELVSARRCIDRLRRKRETMPLASVILIDERDDALRALVRREGLDLVSSAVKAMKAPCRDLIMRRFGEGLSYRALSPLLGKSEGALRVQMYRCLREVRRLLVGRLSQEPVVGDANR